MPVIPDRFLQAPQATSPSNGEPGVKRSKSLLARMRNKKGAMISSPTTKDAQSESNYFGHPTGAPPLPYERSNSGQSLSSEAGKEQDKYVLGNDPFNSSAEMAHSADNSTRYYRLEDSPQDGRPVMGPRRSTSPIQQKMMQSNYLKPTMSSPSTSAYGDDHSGNSSGTHSARRSPQPPSPLGLPEAPADLFGSSTGMKPSMSRSYKNTDLANESALAAVLAESSSKESGMTHSTSSSSNNSGYGYHNNQQHGGNSSGYGYAHTDTSYASDKTSTPERSRLESSLGNSTSSSMNTSSGSPAEGKLSRKTSLASRLLRGRTKRNS